MAGEQSRWPLVATPVAYVLALCVPVLLGGGGLVLGASGLDLGQQFVGQREFGFGELGRGALPLWNPHIFSGMPALGNVQLGLCYPFNLVFLALPLAAAFNISIMFHLALAGVCMGMWARSLGLRLVPSLAAGILYLGCGAHYSHVLAGHQTVICLLPWAPLLFWSIDAVARDGRWGAVVAGAASLAMMLLAGSPQYVFHLGFVAAPYALLRLARTAGRARKTLMLAAVPLLAAGVSAFQLAAMLQAKSGTLREGLLPFDYAATFSLPPENLLTLLNPFPWGGEGGEGYWGRWYLWETQLFFGITGLVMALLALGRRGARDRWLLLGMTLCLLVLALGDATPLFRFLYDHLPPFGYFRGHAKWTLPASLLLVLLSARGLKSFLEDPGTPRALPGALSAAAALTGAVALVLWRGSAGAAAPGWWHSFLSAISGKNYGVTDLLLADEAFRRAALGGTARSLGVAAGTLLTLAILVRVARQRPRFAAAVVALAILEVFLFNRAYLTAFPLEAARRADVAAALGRDPGDYRVHVLDSPNSAMSTGALDAWGYDPFVPRRYAEFMAFAQGVPIDTSAVDIPIRRWDPLLALLRLRYFVAPDAGGGPAVAGPFPHLPRALVVPEFDVAPLPGEPILRAMREPGFDPYRTAILEEAPIFPAGAAFRDGAARGTASVRALSTDELIIDAASDAPALVLLTDPYFPGWRATPLPGSPQRSYRILRADHVLQAIPIAAGTHRIRLEFAPPGLERWGIVSLGTAFALICASAVLGLRSLARRAPASR